MIINIFDSILINNPLCCYLFKRIFTHLYLSSRCLIQIARKCRISSEMVAFTPPCRSGRRRPCCPGGSSTVPAGPLARLRGASAAEGVEGSCRGAAEGLEAGPAAPPLGSPAHPDHLALPPGQRGLPAAGYRCAAAAGAEQRLPPQAEVSSPAQPLLQPG